MIKITGCETPDITSDRRKVKIYNVNISVKNISWSARKI